MFVHERLDPNDQFRQRRDRHRRSRRRRRNALFAVLLLAGAATPIAVFVSGGDGSRAASTVQAPAAAVAATSKALPRPRAVPNEIRGVHITMPLASLPGRIDQYIGLRQYGLNTIEVDVKDESGQVGFASASAPDAQATGAVHRYYDPKVVAEHAHGLGIYLIGRVVVFEDPVLARARPQFALRRPDGQPWVNNAGLGWVSEYDRGVWKYVVDVAEGAARAGFDEIQFDYVRFPSDGNVESIVYPGRRVEPKSVTINRFLQYAVSRLRPLGVRVSADIFGLAATHDLHIGQVPATIGRTLDAIYPMVYPSHYSSGEFNLPDPEAAPGPTVSGSVIDFNRATRGKRARIIPWIQDFSLRRTYTLFEVRQQIAAARAAGVGGFLLWNPRGVYTTDALRPR